MHAQTTYPTLAVHGAGSSGKRSLTELEYGDVGSVWQLGEGAALKRTFPLGLAGDLADGLAGEYGCVHARARAR